MKKILMAFIFVFMSTVAYAEENNTLTEAQQAQVELLAAKLKKQNADATAKANKFAPPLVTEVPGAKKVDEWVDVGIKIGQAMGGAAREMSIAVNDFAKTPVGIITMVVIVFKTMGAYVINMVVHVAGGATLLLFGTGMILYIGRRTRRLTVTYDTEGKRDLFGRTVLKEKVYSAMTDDNVGWITLIGGVTIALVLCTTFSW